MMKHRLTRIILAAVAVAGFIGVPVASASAASAASAATIICNPRSAYYSVKEGSVNISMGTITLNTNICMNGKTMYSKSASMKWVASAPGAAAGYKYYFNATQLNSLGSDGASWISSATIRLCQNVGTAICTEGEMFKVYYPAYAAGFIGPPAPTKFTCLNSICHLTFTRVY